MDITVEVTTIVIVLSGIKADCPKDWEYHRVDNICFRYYYEATTWRDARRRCTNDGDDLLQIWSADQENYIKGSGSCWIGFRDQDGDGNIEDLQREPVCAITPGGWPQVDVTSNQCVLLTFDGLVGQDCSTKNYYVCQKTVTWTLQNIRCPRSWKSRRSDQLCFRFFEDNKSWDEARTYCQKAGGDLIQIQTEEQQTFVFQYFEDDSTLAWIGASEEDGDDNLEGLNGTKGLEVIDGWPDIAHKSLKTERQCICVGRDYHSWRETSCDIELPYACQIPLIQNVSVKHRGNTVAEYCMEKLLYGTTVAPSIDITIDPSEVGTGDGNRDKSKDGNSGGNRDTTDGPNHGHYGTTDFSVYLDDADDACTIEYCICKKKYWWYLEHVNKYIKVNKAGQNFTIAEFICEHLGGRLLTITDAKTGAFLQNLGQWEDERGVLYWMGLSKKNDQWKWNNGQTLDKNDYQNWLDPPSARRNCAGARWNESDKWRTADCATNQYHICEAIEPCVAYLRMFFNNKKIMDNATVPLLNEQEGIIKCSYFGYPHVIHEISAFCGQDLFDSGTGMRAVVMTLTIDIHVHERRCSCRMTYYSGRKVETSLILDFKTEPRFVDEDVNNKTYPMYKKIQLVLEFDIYANPKPWAYNLTRNGSGEIINHRVRIQPLPQKMLHYSVMIELVGFNILNDTGTYTLPIGNGIEERLVYMFSLEGMPPQLIENTRLKIMLGLALACFLTFLIIVCIAMHKDGMKRKLQDNDPMYSKIYRSKMRKERQSVAYIPGAKVGTSVCLHKAYSDDTSIELHEHFHDSSVDPVTRFKVLDVDEKSAYTDDDDDDDGDGDDDGDDDGDGDDEEEEWRKDVRESIKKIRAMKSEVWGTKV